MKVMTIVIGLHLHKFWLLFSSASDLWGPVLVKVKVEVKPEASPEVSLEVKLGSWLVLWETNSRALSFSTPDAFAELVFVWDSILVEVIGLGFNQSPKVKVGVRVEPKAKPKVCLGVKSGHRPVCCDFLTKCPSWVLNFLVLNSRALFLLLCLQAALPDTPSSWTPIFGVFCEFLAVSWLAPSGNSGRIFLVLNFRALSLFTLRFVVVFILPVYWHKFCTTAVSNPTLAA
jgi:hypothetical protein